MTRRTGRQTAVVIAITALTSLFGFAREVMVAHRFGTGAAADVWGIAGMLVAISTEFLLLAGPVATAAIPLLAERRLHDKSDLEQRGFSALVLTMLAASAAVGVLFLVAAGPIGHVFAPGFVGERRALLAPVLRWVGASLIPIAVAGALAAGLQSRRRFARPALTGLAVHVGVIGSLVWLVPHMGVQAVAVGVFIGAALGLLLQTPALIDPGVAAAPDWSIVRGLMALAVPVTAIFFVREATLILERIFASTLPTGQLATLYYAGKLEQFPLGLFGISIAVVAYPDLAELGISGRTAELGASVASALRFVLLLAVPSAVGLAALADPIIRLVLEHGAFGAASGAATLPVLVAFSVGLVGQSAIPVVLRGYFAMKKMVEPGIVLGVVLALNLVLDAVLLRFAALGLGIAFAVTMTLGALGLAIFFGRRVPFVRDLDLGRLAVTLAVGSAALWGAARWCAGSIDAIVGHATLWARAAVALGGVGGGVAAYALLLAFARVPELGELYKWVRPMKQ